MTQLLERPPTLPPRARRRRDWLSQNEDVRSVQVGLVLTLIFWPLLIWLVAQGLSHVGEVHGGKTLAPKPKPSFDFDFTADDEPVAKKEPPAPPPPDRFVEVNPDAPENIPDKTRNFGAQNQQVAQEKPTPDGKNDMPATQGKKDIESNQVVDSTLTPPEHQTPPAPPPTPEMKQALAEAQVQREQNPLSGFEKVQGDSAEGFGFNKAAASKTPTDVPEKREGTADSQIFNGAAQTEQIKIDPQRPMPRPTVDRVKARPAILAERLGTQNVGVTGCDARWSQYGQYLQQFIETVQIQWEQTMQEGRIFPPPGSEVRVKFRMNSEGVITEVIENEGTGGAQYKGACASGITLRSPYGKWSEEMIAVLGTMQEMTFTFVIR